MKNSNEIGTKRQREIVENILWTISESIGIDPDFDTHPEMKGVLHLEVILNTEKKLHYRIGKTSILSKRQFTKL